MLNSKPLIVSLSLAVIVTSALLVGFSGVVHKWERENGYPFGYMCHSVFTLYENTCDLKKRR